jgi:hypothetical protein
LHTEADLGQRKGRGTLGYSTTYLETDTYAFAGRALVAALTASADRPGSISSASNGRGSPAAPDHGNNAPLHNCVRSASSTSPTDSRLESKTVSNSAANQLAPRGSLKCCCWLSLCPRPFSSHSSSSGRPLLKPTRSFDREKDCRHSNFNSHAGATPTYA